MKVPNFPPIRFRSLKCEKWVNSFKRKQQFTRYYPLMVASLNFSEPMSSKFRNAALNLADAPGRDILVQLYLTPYSRTIINAPSSSPSISTPQLHKLKPVPPSSPREVLNTPVFRTRMTAVCNFVLLNKLPSTHPIQHHGVDAARKISGRQTSVAISVLRWALSQNLPKGNHCRTDRANAATPPLQQLHAQRSCWRSSKSSTWSRAPITQQWTHRTNWWS